MAIDEGLVQVAAAPDGLTIVGRRIGDTIVQAFTSSARYVYVVNVQPPPPAPPGPPPIPNINDHGAITGFWGDNRYEVRYSDSSLVPYRLDHLATFHGRAGAGEYQASAQFMTGGLGNRLQYGSLGWWNDAKDLSFEVGDTNGRTYGTSLSSAVPVRGLRSGLTRKLDRANAGEWMAEIFAGEVRGAADPCATSLTQPAVGASVTGVYVPKAMADLRLSFGSSVLGFSMARASAFRPGDSGLLVGGIARAVHKNGLGLELRSAVSASAPHVDGAMASTVPSFGVTAQYQTSRGGQRLDYEDNRRGFVTPQTGGALPGYRRLSGSFDRRAKGFGVSASGSYAKVEDISGQSGSALSYQLGATFPLTRQTNLSLACGQSSIVMPTYLITGDRSLREWSQAYASARFGHMPVSGAYALLSNATLSKTSSGDTSTLGASGNITFQKRRGPKGKWDGSATLGAMANQAERKESVPAVDQPPLSFAVTAAGQGRFVQGPFESFGGLGLQVMASPTYRVAPTVNLGIRLTPTAAHQLVATLNAFRWMQGGAWTYGASVNYTHHFGDAVHAMPIFEFMSYGVVEGRVCFDEDSDGECSTAETPIPGIPLVLSNGARTRTAADGSYRFERVKPGFYHLDVDEAAMREKGQPTTMLAVSFDLAVRGSESRNFAVARACRIQGHVVHDLNLDGLGEEEPLFGGPLVVATAGEATFQARVNNAGTFALTVPCGEYGLAIDPASLPAMHSPGDDEEIRVTTQSTEVAIVELLVRSIRTISGTVFIDGNGNGRRDAGEAIVAGAVARFGDVAGPTDETGAFLLRRLPAGAGELTVDPASLPAGLAPGAPVPKSLPNDAAAIENVHLPVVPAP